MPLGLLDLSLVTNSLVKALNDTWNNDPDLWKEDTPLTTTPPATAADFTLKFTGLAPDNFRNSTSDDDSVDCYVSVYLFHVAADKHHRNTFPLGGRAQPTPPQPLGLTLYYLVTAYDKGSHTHEQQGMSVALKFLHDHPVMSATVPHDKRTETFTLTIEPQTVDEIGRLWQALGAPMRLSAVYRVGVIFLEEPEPDEPKVVRHEPGFLDRPKPSHPAHDENQVTATTEFPEAVGAAVADVNGLATIALPGLSSAAQVKVRARAFRRVTGTPLGGEFQVTLDAKLVICLPLYTPAGQYLVTVVPAPERAALTFSLDVPARIVFASVDRNDGLAAFVADDAKYASGVTTVSFGPSLATPLHETGNAGLLSGEFRTEDDALYLRVPSGTQAGTYPLLVKRSNQTPNLGLWLQVKVDVP